MSGELDASTRSIRPETTRKELHITSFPSIRVIHVFRDLKFTYEQRSSFSRNKKGRVHPYVGWRAQTMEGQRPAFCGLGNLSHERVAG